jgi:hypothetical protein
MTNITQQPTAKYFIDDTFKITGRGLVFLGRITEGEVSTGDIMEFKGLGTVMHRKITNVDSRHSDQSGKINTSILIKCENEAEIDKLRNSKPDQQVALIYTTETPGMNLSAAQADPPTAEPGAWWQKLFG